MHRGLDCLLLLWWMVTTLTVVLGWPINQPNAQQPTEIVASQYHSSSPALCNDSRCSCTSHSASQHAGLTHVNCQCTPQDQEATLDVYPSSVPRDVSLVAIRSCRSVIFHEGGIKHLNNLSIVTVEDAGEVLFHSGSFNQLKVETKTAVTIGRCRQLLIKTAAFVSHSHSPVAVNSSHCHSVRIEESAFSRLSRLTLANIQFLHLASHAFRFTTVSPQDGDHIKTEILIEHVTMTELKSFTFPSPLDHLVFENVTISGQIHANATSALRIVRLSISDSRIGWIAAGAFSEFTHLDWLEMLNTRVGHIDGRAFSSAASSITIEGCQIGRMNQSALSMPVARVSLHSNHIDVLATGALNLREWNELLIENNTVTLIERHAFYNIGEPKLLPSPYAAGAGRVRFIIRHNVFHQVQLGAFIISAEVPQLKLEDNHFQHNCDCQMAGWAAQLTQITRRTETTTAESFLEEEEEDDDVSSAPRALWLGSSLFNSSLCRLDQAAAECLDLADQPQFLSMKNYTDEFCPAAQENEFSRCLAMKRSSIDISRIIDFKTDDDADGSSGIKLVDFSSRQDLVMIIVLSALCVLVFLAVCLGLVVARFRTKSRQQQRSNKKIVSNDERVTCSPLIPSSSNVEKQLGSGVVSSGSISRLSVKDYRNYLEDLGPIYSEPLEPPESNAWIKHVPPTDLAPPDVPAMPVQWTPKGGVKADDDANKRTIDRGTQTLEDSTNKVSESENLSSTSNGQPLASSLALEFTQDVMAALRDKMDVSPLYSEVKDSIVSKQLDNNEESAALTKGTSTITPEFYDLIKVVDQGAGPRPSTSSARSEHIYCKPWDDADPSGSKNRLPSSVAADETPPPPPAEGVELKVDKESSGGDALLLLPPPAKQKNNVPVAIKSQPFHVRGSLPKWPPPAIKTPSQNRSGSRTTNSSTCSPPTSPVKDAHKPAPSWQSSSRSIPAVRKSPTKTRSEHNNTSQKTSSHQPTGKSNKESTVVQSNSSNVVISPSPSQQSKDEGPDEEYAEVTPQPFSFSFRRPLFADRPNNSKETKKSINSAAAEGPPKPARSPVAQLCEYADPRDLNEPLYSELIVQDEQQQQQHDNL